MAGFNPNTPTKRGMEWLPRYKRSVVLDAPDRGILIRTKADAATALANFHYRFASVLGDQAGLALERLDIPWPTITQTLYYPGTDTGNTVTGFQDQGGSTANFGEIDDWSTSDYHRNTSALAATSSLKLKFRGSSSALTSATRVTKVTLEALVRVVNSTSTGAGGAYLVGVLDIGGTEYVASGGVRVPRDGAWKNVTIAEWTLDPSTGLPWVSTSVDDLWSSTDEFGFYLFGKIAATGFNVAGMRLRVSTCVENRKAFYYSGVSPESGWGERAASSAGTVTSGAFDWLLVYALNGSAQNALEVPVLGDPQAVETTDPTKTGEQRIAYECRLSHQGGTVVGLVDPVGIELPAFLVDVSGIANQSQPFTDLVAYELADKIGGVDLTGASGTYISTPDSAALSITGDQEIWAWIAADDWTPSSQQTIAAKWTTTGNQRSIRLDLTTAGELRLYWSNDGSTENSAAVSSATLGSIGATDGQGIMVGASIDVDNGASGRDIKYYYSLDGGTTVTQLGSTRTSATATSVFDSTAAFEIGGYDSGTAQRFTGKVYRARLYAGLTRLDVRADPVFCADPAYPATTAAKVASTSIGDQQGNTWTLNGAAAFDRYGVAQQITTAAQTDYIGVEVAVGWSDASRPDAPLVVEVRSGTAGAVGDGTLLATGYVWPEDVNVASGTRLVARFASAATHAATTQYHIRVSSATSPNAGWRVWVGDTRSDDIGSGTTLAEIEGASQGGQTDSFVDPLGTVLDRYDWPCCLVAAGSAPSSPAATAYAAA